MNPLNRPRIAPRLFVAASLCALVWAALDLGRASFAADSPPKADVKADAKPPAEKTAADKGSDPSAADKAFDKAFSAAPSSAPKPEKKAADVPSMPTIDPWEMFQKGGILMYPITFMSLVVVAFSIERAIGLRRKKVVPRKLVKGLSALAASPGGFDPRKAYRLCQQCPSSAANVVRAMLLKTGRPTDEVERAVADSISRESWKLNYNVRPLVLAVTVTPLMGLLGTVQGMIIAFFKTAHTPVGQDRALVLADGIYLKLITTFAGLVVAIPALVIAHYFEGRIQALMREVEDLVQSVLPQVEKYEGKLRTTRQATGIEPPPVVKAEALGEPAIAQSEGA
jgi:biopolymer transport protein ExbB